MAKLDHPCSQGGKFIALEIDMNYMKKQVDKIENQVNKIDEKIDSIGENLQGKFADKRVEKAVGGLIAIMGSAVIGAILKMVLN